MAKRNGEILKVDLLRLGIKDVAKRRNSYYFDFSGLAMKASARARLILHRLGLKMLLLAIKRQNISFAGIGKSIAGCGPLINSKLLFNVQDLQRLAGKHIFPASTPHFRSIH